MAFAFIFIGFFDIASLLCDLHIYQKVIGSAVQQRLKLAGGYAVFEPVECICVVNTDLYYSAAKAEDQRDPAGRAGVGYLFSLGAPGGDASHFQFTVTSLALQKYSISSHEVPAGTAAKKAAPS